MASHVVSAMEQCAQAVSSSCPARVDVSTRFAWIGSNQQAALGSGVGPGTFTTTGAPPRGEMQRCD